MKEWGSNVSACELRPVGNNLAVEADGFLKRHESRA